MKLDDIRLHAVEADPALFGWLRQHMADNAIPAEALRLHQAAIGEVPGEVLWPGRAAGAADYGARPMDAADRDHRGVAVAAPQRVRVLPIAELLEMEPVWDLVHMDLQGLEARLCAAAMKLLGERARHVVVATHSAALDAACFGLFHKAGWDAPNHLPPQVKHRRHAVSIEAMTELDGTQFWRNPALTP
jgi:FkbM family methyltransferase